MGAEPLTAGETALERTLIVGIVSGPGRLLARKLGQHAQVIGVDRRDWPSRPPDLPVHSIDARGAGFEALLRNERPDAVVHLGLTTRFAASSRRRHLWNVRGTRALLDACRRTGVERVAVVSASHVYGALPDTPALMDEDQPLLASGLDAAFHSLVEADTLASAFMWRYPDLRVSILRPVASLGFHASTSLADYLRQRRAVSVLGFDPMLQFIHEDDLAEALQLCLEQGVRGVFNVTGPGEVPLSVALAECGARRVPVPGFVAARVLEGRLRWPRAAMRYLKYGCTVSGERFRARTGFRPLFGLRETFRSLR